MGTNIRRRMGTPEPGISSEEGAILLTGAPRQEPDHLVSPLQSGRQTMGNPEMESSLLSRAEQWRRRLVSCEGMQREPWTRLGNSLC